MNISELFTGTISHIYASSLIIIFLMLMFFMSLRLFLSRRRKTYFSLTISLFIMIVQYFLLIIVEGTNQIHNDFIAYITQFMEVLSFILVNMGIYQLYNPMRTKQFLFFYSCIVFAFLVSLTHFGVGKWFNNATGQLQLLQGLGLELYLFLLLFICYHSITPRIGQSKKYQFGLIVYFFSRIFDILNVYIFEHNQPFLSIAGNFLPIIFYAILFMILFERVVELLQASYTNSITDMLTGLYNRRYFVNRSNQYVQHGIPVSILFSDIDNFKRLNDTEGHQKGDEALKHVARIMKEECEEIGLCGRYGGEEIVVLVTDPDTKVPELAENIRKRVEVEAGVTVSIGYSKHRVGISAETLLKQADEAMYKAKSSGKNKVVKYNKVPPIQM